MRSRLLAAYQSTGLWGETNPARPLPDGFERGSDPHLAYLTLVTTLSGGRSPTQLWIAARQTAVSDPDLFNPHFLAYAKPQDLIGRLQAHRLTQKPKSEATTWQRIGQALVMRAGGSVHKLLADHAHDAQKLMAMLARSKTTFPVLSGPQTAPRWLYGLAAVGQQPLSHADRLPIPVSPAAARALTALNVRGSKVTAPMFAPLDALGRLGCLQKAPDDMHCPAADICPVSEFCQYG